MDQELLSFLLNSKLLDEYLLRLEPRLQLDESSIHSISQEDQSEDVILFQKSLIKTILISTCNEIIITNKGRSLIQQNDRIPMKTRFREQNLYREPKICSSFIPVITLMQLKLERDFRIKLSDTAFGDIVSFHKIFKDVTTFLTDDLSEVDAEVGLSSKLSSIEGALIRYVLKNSIAKIIASNSGNKNISGDYKYVPKEEKFEKIKESGIYYKSTLELMDKALSRLLYDKMGTDIDYIRSILTDTYNEIKADGTFKSLNNAIEIERLEAEDEYNLFTDYVQNKNNLMFLEKKLLIDSEEGKRKTKELDGKIHDLDNEINDCQIENSIKIRLVKKWEQVRIEQEDKLLKIEENKLKETHNETVEKISRETRACHDIEAYIKFKMESLEELTEFWINKYETESEQLDNEIHATKEKIAEIKMKSDELKDIYDVRQKEMDDYYEIKRNQKEAFDLANLQWQSAVQIQSWWRGVMVRKGFGRFRRKKGKKGKGKKK